MMRTIDTARLARAAMVAMCVYLPCAAAHSDRQIDCPSSTAMLSSAAPILGRLDEPWGELHEVESTRQKDRSYVVRYDLTGGEAAQIEKWLVCRYRDGSQKAIPLPVSTRECRIRTKEDGPASPATGGRFYRVEGIVCG
jgi:hypothetical protein